MVVIEFCTCGAKVPEDARFCHKCGRPLYEVVQTEVEPEPAEAAPPPLPAAGPPPKSPGVTFRNPGAVRVGMLVAAVICLLQSVPLPALIQPIWLLLLLLGGGFLSVYLYHRRTGDAISVLAGARLGWMTGLFVFLVTLVLFTITIVGMGMQKFFQEILSVRGTPELSDQFDAILQSPGGLAAMLFLALLTMFFLLTVVTSAGGALAAKVLEKE
jgi:hypothetical protein